MLQIWGRKNSNQVIHVMWAIGELKIEHIRYNVGGSFGGLQNDDYKNINPNMLIPTIKDGKLISG